MRKWFWWGAFLILTAGGLLGSEGGRAVLSGKVITSAGYPVTDALIILRLKSVSGPQSATFITASESGEFSIQLASGVYDVFVSATCLAPFAQRLSVPESGRVALNPVLQGGIEICDVEVGPGLVPTTPSQLPDKVKPK